MYKYLLLLLVLFCGCPAEQVATNKINPIIEQGVVQSIDYVPPSETYGDGVVYTLIDGRKIPVPTSYIDPSVKIGSKISIEKFMGFWKVKPMK